MLRNFFIPNKNNNHTPHLLHQRSLVLYMLLLLIINIGYGFLPLAKVKAQVDINALYELHNQERERNGLTRLSINSDLIESANEKAAAMLAADCWSHYCPDGKSPWDFFENVGYTYIYAGENLAEGFDTDEAAMKAWMNSPTHRANIVKPEFREVGIGYAVGDFQGISNNTVIVVHFGSRSDSNSIQPASSNSNATNNVKITNPIDGSYTSDETFEITGTSPDNSTVQLNSNGKQIGRVSATGKNFTYRPAAPFKDGSYDLRATAYDNQEQLLGVSDTVTVVVDTQAPVILIDSLKVNSINYNTNEFVIISVNTLGEPNILTSNIEGVSFKNIGANKWEAEINKDNLAAITNLSIAALDKAGNKSSIEVPTKTVLSQVLALEAIAPYSKSVESNVFSSFIGRIISWDLKVQINMLFVAFLGILFGLDFYIISKSGLTGIERGKSHLHLSSFIIILIIAVIGGIGGSILTGSETIL